jgi:enoyl-CoA hydratase
MSTVLVEQADAVVTVTLNRPEKLNALNEELVRELRKVVADLVGRGGIRAVIVTGAGDKAFAAGADIAAMSGMTFAQALAFARMGHDVGDALEHAPFPVLAAVNGFALGGGCEIALACDFIYASDRAKFAQPEVNLGVIPGFGGTQRLLRRVGEARARELCMTGDILGAEEALRIGLVNAVVPHAELLPKVREVAAKIASKGPKAIAAAKDVIRRGADMELSKANDYEAHHFAELFETADQKEGMKAFLEKRPAKFEGR